MINISFCFNQVKTIIQANLKDTFQCAIDKYTQKSSLNPDNLIFLLDDTEINAKQNIESQKNFINKKDNQMEIIVKSKEENKNQIIVKSKQIICPKCHEPCKISFENNRVNLYHYINNHVTNVNLKNYQSTQEINLSKIICNVCKKRNKGNSNKNEFFKCLTCIYNLCNLCKSTHDPKHIVVEYELKDSICKRHNDKFIKFCLACKLNIYIVCELEHKEHETIYFGEMMINNDELKSLLLNIKNDKGLFKAQLKEVIKKLTEFSEDFDIYYEIKNDIINNYDIRNKDFYMLHN